MDRANPAEDDRSNSGSDFLGLRIDQAPPGAMSGWLADRIRAAIQDRQLRAGDRLPASRTLAGDLGVSRGVITEAYRRLVDDGVVVAGGRAGTVVAGCTVPTTPVAGARSTDPRRPTTPPDPPAADIFARRLRGDVFTALRAAPARVDLSPGVPDLAAFPRTGWLHAERGVLDRLTPDAFGYGDPAGAPRFRGAVAGWLARYRGITVDPTGIVVVAGVAQALALLCRVLGRRGISTIGVEDPGSLGARRQLQDWGMSTVGVAVDDAGLRVEALRATGAPAVLVSPAHQFPMGVVLDGARRRELTDWAADGGLVIEDDYDAEHRYDRPPVTALHAALPDRVCYTGSVSKILAPALRVGWLIPPGWLLDEVVAAKQEADLGNPVLAQLVLARLMESGQLERHLRMIRRRHRRRRDAMIGALARHLPGATVHGTAAGLHLTITIDDPIEDTALAAAALAAGVKVQPLSWHRIDPGPAGLVLGYAACSAGEIEQGLAVLGAVLARTNAARLIG
jgi:GntR family transcriptional regulator/MocR family aminotransferase